MKMRSFYILALFCMVGWSSSQKCPTQYLRFTPQHTFCLPPNPSCQLRRTGVSKQDKELILRLHNQFRSKTAMGNEHRAIGGSLPQAADMIQMEWDDELAAVAQKWTENCKWGHDCKECKAVENFMVGQNLAIQHITQCSRCRVPSDEPDWTWALTRLYDEVVDYHVDWLDSFIQHPGPKTGHLTQILWSRSWRVGCGYSFYKHEGRFHRYYACNYGPGGNVDEEPVYKQGRPCTACPTNTQCSTSGNGPNIYPGLCKMINPNTAPVYPMNQNGQLFYCGASSSDPDCQAEASGDGNWRTVHSLGGNYESIVLNGGQSATITFNKSFKPYGEFFCLALNFRKGPVDASRGDKSSLQVNFKNNRGSASHMELHSKTTNFIGYYINLRRGETTLGFTFSVPRGSGQHVLDLRKVEAYEGSCNPGRI